MFRAICLTTKWLSRLSKGLDRPPSQEGCHVETSYYSAPEVDLALYDHVIVCLSGGKDSIAAYLRLLDMG